MVVVSNETAAAGPLKQKAFQRAETLASQRGHEFERSKLLTATLPLVTRMFLLGRSIAGIGNTDDPRRMRELLGSRLPRLRAFLLVESFEHFWTYTSATWAGKFLDASCTRAARSRLEPLKKVARTLKRHRHLLLNYFEAKKEFSNSIVEDSTTS